MNLIPKWVWWGAWVLVDELGVMTKGYGNCKCRMLSIVVDFMILSNIYCFLFWVCRLYLLSTCVLYWPLLVCFSLVICGVQQTCRHLQLNSNSSQSSPRQISGWAIVPSSDWILSHSCLDVLEVRTWTISCICFSFLDILRFSNLRIDVLVMMTSRFWGW